MVPFTTQCAGTVAVASTHRGALNVTAETGSPIDDTGIVVPSRSAVHRVGSIAIGIVGRSSTGSAPQSAVEVFATEQEARPKKSKLASSLKQ
jgi:hypothetical protein